MRVIAIQKNFVGGVHFVTPTRTFVREGTLLKVCRKVEKQRYLIKIEKKKKKNREYRHKKKEKKKLKKRQDLQLLIPFRL